MKKCPTCEVALLAEDYAGVKVARCPGCRGVFMAKFRLEMINHQAVRSRDALKAEAKSEFMTDTIKQIRCPGCGGFMAKRPIASRYTPLLMDCCRACDGVWLDGGELAIIQMVYSASTRGMEAQEFKRRVRELEADPERKKQFETALAALPEDLPSATSDRDAYWIGDYLLDLLGTSIQ
jgi:Zn-finger nucleic acid-binding protein